MIATKVPITGPSTEMSAKMPAAWLTLEIFDIADPVANGYIRYKQKRPLNPCSGRGGEEKGKGSLGMSDASIGGGWGCIRSGELIGCYPWRCLDHTMDTQTLHHPSKQPTNIQHTTSMDDHCVDLYKALCLFLSQNFIKIFIHIAVYCMIPFKPSAQLE